jgi:hypothetical protein
MKQTFPELAVVVDPAHSAVRVNMLPFSWECHSSAASSLTLAMPSMAPRSSACG